MTSIDVTAEGLRRRARLRSARLYLVVEAEPGGRPAEELLARALPGGVDAVQLREKGAPDGAIVDAGRRMLAVCRAHGALLVVNDRPDLALAGGADGVHVGQEDAAVEEARAIVGENLLVGVSTHCQDEIAAARASSADYLGVGPVFPTATKPEVRPVGIGLVRHAAARAGKPFFAIGGIDGRNVAEVAAAGARRVAVVRAIRDAEDPRTAAAALRAALIQEAGVGAPP